jgi:multiple sugar transport system ATP-binding protein
MHINLPDDRQKQLALNRQRSGPMELGIRPEYIRIVPEGTENAIKAQVGISEMMGSEVYQHINIDGMEAVIRMQVPDLPYDYAFEAESVNYVYITFSPERICLFNKETGQSLYLP